MKQSESLPTMEILCGNDMIYKCSFKTTDAKVSYALLARQNHNLAMGFANPGEESALFCVLFNTKDCFECLSPHKTAA